RLYSNRLKIPEAGCGKPCNAGRLREAEGCRPYRLRFTPSLTLRAVILVLVNPCQKFFSRNISRC
ncbi:MAG: hypothetical protein FWC50_12770, partial [Planctomycetaceae bacterium]|nr:hypothetical protein [Planctomycetaceae bacterium]